MGVTSSRLHVNLTGQDNQTTIAGLSGVGAPISSVRARCDVRIEPGNVVVCSFIMHVDSTEPKGADSRASVC